MTFRMLADIIEKSTENPWLNIETKKEFYSIAKQIRKICDKEDQDEKNFRANQSRDTVY